MSFGGNVIEGIRSALNKWLDGVYFERIDAELEREVPIFPAGSIFELKLHSWAKMQKLLSSPDGRFFSAGSDISRTRHLEEKSKDILKLSCGLEFGPFVANFCL